MRKSCWVLRVTIVTRCLRKTCSISISEKTRGLPSTIANIIIPKLSCNCVCLYRLFKTISACSPLFNSMTIRIPSRSDSSRMSEIPSTFFSCTNRAVRSITLDLLTWYGISVITICCLSRPGRSMAALARIVKEPRPVR